MKKSVFSRVRSASENLNVYIAEMKIFMVFTEKEKIFFLFYCLHANARFWHHKLCRQTKHEHHGVDVQHVKLERQKQELSFDKSKLSCYQNVPYILIKKMNTNT